MKNNKIIFYATTLVLLLGIHGAGFSETSPQFQIKEKAELERILASIDLTLNDMEYFKLGDSIRIAGVKNYATRFQTSKKKAPLRSFNKIVITDKNSHVVGLSIKGRFTEIDALNNLPFLRWVCLDGDLKKLTGLSGLVRLEELIVRSNKIESIENLNLPKLAYLNLYRNKLASIAALSNLNSLIYLNLSDNNIKNIEFIKNFTHLRYLDVSINKIEEAKLPSTLGKLQHFVATGNTIKKMCFQKLTSLESVTLTNQPIELLSGLHNIINIKELILVGSKLRQVDLLALKSLEVFKISSSYLSVVDSIKNLSALKKLRKLSINDSPLTYVSNIGDLVSLTFLNLSGNKIISLSGLEELNDVEEINLSNNKISKIQGLDHLKKLKLLDLSNNPIEVFEGITSPVLSTLDLSNTKISSIKGFSTLPGLKRLELGGTQIRTISDYDEYTTRRDSLLYIYLPGNGLTFKDHKDTIHRLNKSNVKIVF